MIYFILIFYFNIIFGQIGLPTFQGIQKISSSSLNQECGTQGCGGSSLCSEPECEKHQISMRWHSSSENRPDNLVLTMQGGNTVTLSARVTGDRGWYLYNSQSNANNGQHTSSNQNTYTGNMSGTKYYRSWFSWSLSSIAGQTVTAAKIELDIDSWYNVGGGTDAYSKIWEVSNTTHAEIVTTKNNVAGKEIWNDLGNGLLYSCEVIDRNNLGLYTFQLSSSAVSKINGLNGGYFIVGNSISCE